MDGNDVAKAGTCPVMHAHTTLAAKSNRDWWPNQLNLRLLHQNAAPANPLGGAFDYARAFKTLDLGAD